MNIQSNLKNILDKFPKDEVQLESHKVDLALADDLKKMFDVVDKTSDDIFGWRKPTQEKVNQIRSLKEQIRNRLDNTEDDIKYLDTFIPKLQSLKDKLSKSAKELGVNPKDIKGFDKIDIRIRQIKDKSKDFKSDSKEARKESKQ
jgi:predicted  nucleic acid-binding Zn-ribbon protein|tara:strand:+ start:977 stop:1411 length:435 start_codon:yes stop_codon:yes gene_type:complete